MFRLALAISELQAAAKFPRGADMALVYYALQSNDSRHGFTEGPLDVKL